MGMSRPSSRDSDELVGWLGDMDIKKGSSAPGPSDTEGVLQDLLEQARRMNLSVEDQPSRHNAYKTNFSKSEYDPSTDGPSDPSEKARTIVTRGGWKCPILSVDGIAYKGCVLYGTPCPNVGILGLHLSQHHPNIEFHWRTLKVRQNAYSSP